MVDAKVGSGFPAKITVSSPIELTKTGREYHFNLADAYFDDVVDAVLAASVGVAHNVVSVTASPHTVASTTTLLLCNFGAALVINLPAASSRTRSITVKDISGAANSNNITINRAGSDTIDGATSDSILTDYGARTYTPITGGWAIL